MQKSGKLIIRLEEELSNMKVQIEEADKAVEFYGYAFSLAQSRRSVLLSDAKFLEKEINELRNNGEVDRKFRQTGTDTERVE